MIPRGIWLLQGSLHRKDPSGQITLQVAFVPEPKTLTHHSPEREGQAVPTLSAGLNHTTGFLLLLFVRFCLS